MTERFCLHDLYLTVINMHSSVMDVEYMWIFRQENKLSSIWVANMDKAIVSWWVCSSNSRGENGVKGGGVVILASYKFRFIREHDNMV